MAKKRKAPAPLDLYALDPAAKRSIEVEARRAKEIKGGPRFAARPKSTGSLSRPRRGGIERTADRLYEAGLPLSVTDAIKSVDRNLLGLDDTAQSLRNVMNDEAGAGDYVNLALSSPVGALALKPLELGARGIGRAAMRGGRRALDTRAGRYLTEARPVLEARPRYTRSEDGDFLRVAREGVSPQIIPEAKEAKDLDALRVILKNPETNPAARAANEYTQATFGRPYDLDMPAPGTSLQKQSGIARTFEAAAEGSPEYKHLVFEAYGNQMPEVVEQAGAQNYDQLTEAAYRKLGDEVRDQFAVMPVRTAYHYGVGEYPTPSAMLRDVLGEGNLNVFRGGEPHEFLGDIDPDTQLSLNEMFRAVHDLYGHGTRGSTFRPGGEELAYASHSQMMSPLAQMALLSETRGQNSLVNYSPLNAALMHEMADIRAGIEGERRLARMRGQKVDPSAFAVENARLRELGSQIQYAPQKSLLLPPEYLPAETKGGIPEYLRPAIVPRAPSGPERAVHLSRMENLAETDPAFYGTGHRGEDWAVRGQRGSPAQHTSFYLGPQGTVLPEKVVADVNPFAYETELSGLYDLREDPEGLVALARAHNAPFGRSAIPDLTRMVAEYGYSGYSNDFGPQRAANVFAPVKLKRRIKRGEKGYSVGGAVSAKPSRLDGAPS